MKMTLMCALLAQSVLVSGVTLGEPSRTDFAYGVEVEGVDGTAVGEMPMPLAVYQHTAFDDLRDLRVFNADGEVVPHAIRSQAASQAADVTAALPIFPLRGDVESALKQMQVIISTAGEQVALRTQKDSVSQPVVAYLIDTRTAQQPLVEIELQWADAPQFSASVMVEASDDLQSWRTVVARAPLVNLQFGGQALTEHRIDLPQVEAKYLRLTWGAGQAPFELKSLQGRFQAERAAPVRASTQVVGIPGDIGEFRFDLAARLPVREINVDLPQVNTVAQLEVLSRSRQELPWRTVATVTAYRLLANGQEIRNRPLPAHNSDRYWAVRGSSKGGGLGSGVPVLQVEWEPQRLLFVARGKAPFLLAFGNNKMEQGEAAFDALLSGDPTSRGLIAPLPVRAGRMIELGGAAKLDIQQPTDWKRYLLWGVLVAGVGLLVLMARSLLRETSAS